MAKPDDLPRYRSNFRGELDGAAVYATLAESDLGHQAHLVMAAEPATPTARRCLDRGTAGPSAHG